MYSGVPSHPRTNAGVGTCLHDACRLKGWPVLTSQAPEAEKQPASAQKLEPSSAPNTEMQSNIAAQDNAPQQEAVSDNLQTGAEVVQFEVFGQTQEAINGALSLISKRFAASDICLRSVCARYD